VGWDSIVGMATCYRQAGVGIEFWWGEIFCTLGPTQPDVECEPGPFPRQKVARLWH